MVSSVDLKLMVTAADGDADLRMSILPNIFDILLSMLSVCHSWECLWVRLKSMLWNTAKMEIGWHAYCWEMYIIVTVGNSDLLNPVASLPSSKLASSNDVSPSVQLFPPLHGTDPASYTAPLIIPTLSGSSIEGSVATNPVTSASIAVKTSSSEADVDVPEFEDDEQMFHYVVTRLQRALKDCQHTADVRQYCCLYSVLVCLPSSVRCFSFNLVFVICLLHVYYPHMLIYVDVDISVTVSFIFCVFVRLRIFLSRCQILHGGSSASWAGNLTFWGTLLSQKPKIGRIE